MQYVVGDYGTIMYYNGNNWTRQIRNTDSLLPGIWGNKKNNVSVVGNNTGKHYQK